MLVASFATACWYSQGNHHSVGSLSSVVRFVDFASPCTASLCLFAGGGVLLLFFSLGGGFPLKSMTWYVLFVLHMFPPSQNLGVVPF